MALIPHKLTAPLPRTNSALPHGSALPGFANVEIGTAKCVAIFAVGFLGIGYAALYRAVQHIVRSASCLKVVGIKARRVVTLMQDMALIVNANTQPNQGCDSVHPNNIPMPIDDSVAVNVSSLRPLPASRNWVFKYVLNESAHVAKSILKHALVAIVLLTLVFAQFPFPGGHSAHGAAATAIGPVTWFMDGHGTTAGTTVTTTLLNSATLGTELTGQWALTGTAPTFAASQTGCGTLGGTVQVDGTVYAAAHTSLSVSFPNSNTLSYITEAAPADGFHRGTLLICHVAGISAPTGNFDVLEIIGQGGHAIFVQESTLLCGGSLGFTIESVLPGVSNSACIPFTSGNTYWLVFQWDDTNTNCAAGAPCATLAAYDTSFNQLGSSPVTNPNPANEAIQGVRIGNVTSFTATGTNIWQNPMVAWSAGGPAVLSPTNTTQVPIYWVAQSHNNHGSGTTTTLATTTALDEHAGDTVVVTCSNENASGQTTSVTNTATETFTAAAAVKSAANGQSISQWNTQVASDHAAQTYTCNFPASQFSNIDVEIIHGNGTSPSFDTGAVGNKASGADIASGSFTPSTSTGSNIQCSYIQAGQAITPGTNYLQLNTSATNSMGCQFRANAPNSSQTGTGIHSNTSASMTVVGNYKQ